MRPTTAITLLIALSAGAVAPAFALEPRAHPRTVEKYLNKHLKNRMLVLRTPIAEPARVEFDSEGRALTPFLHGSRRDDSALLFLRAEVRDGRVELLTERLSLARLRRSKDGKRLMISRDPQRLALLRVVVPAPAGNPDSREFREKISHSLLKIFLSSQEWRRSLERDLLAAM